MSAVATAIVGGAVVGAYATNRASKANQKASDRATDAQVASNRENIEFQREVFNQQREDNAPWREIGIQSLDLLRDGLETGEFKKDGGYDFRLQEGIDAIDKSASARGRLNSGAQDRAVTRYASNLASQEYMNAFNRLASLANVGQVANSANQSAGNRLATNVGNSTIATGNAIATNAINQGNNRASAYQNYATAANQGIQNYLLYKTLQ